MTGREPLSLALLGYGRMGREVHTAAEARGHAVVAIVDPAEGGSLEVLADSGARLAIDFTVPSAVLDNVQGVAAAGMDLVIGTTGWADDLPAVTRIAEEAGIGLLHAPNFALGVHLFRRLVQEAVRLAERVGGYEPRLTETHHVHKVDSPSGSAIHLAEAILEASKERTRWEEGEAPPEPDPEAVYVSSRREGEVTGTHTVALEGLLDRLELTHESLDRSVFAHGAVRAAEWIRGRKGVHTIDDLFGADE